MSENPQTCQVPEMKEIPSATELVAEGHLTREEREYMNDMIAQDKEQVFETTRQSCQDFIETDYGGFSEKLLGGRESIVEAKKLLGITPIDGVYSRELFRAIIDFQKENSLKVDGILGKQTLNQIREKVTLVDREASTESTDSLFTLIEGAENTNEVVETVVNEVLRCYIDRLNSRE
ncbi:MAG: peptidoglycan-binding protein [Candidatus Peribacteria bacterium]|nr:MAG: peptidoglycan-binding protein [Candidatus Peribacteria bacterium]